MSDEEVSVENKTRDSPTADAGTTGGVGAGGGDTDKDLKVDEEREWKLEMEKVCDAISVSCADMAIIGALVFTASAGTISAHLQLGFDKHDIMNTLTQIFLYVSVVSSGSTTAILAMLFFFFKMLPARGLHFFVRYFEEITHLPRVASMVLTMVSLGLLGVGGICFLIDVQGFSVATVVVLIVTAIMWTLIVVFVLQFGATYILIGRNGNVDGITGRVLKFFSCKLPPKLSAAKQK
mmetsp:Transcript_17973/g.28415  ORF Transcript_17973/g.28415 Transcript_17973/m.28415 type:complete len:236 (+) Transcript_17973:104-811(+)